jgi:prolyl-tRNA synthetase
MLRAGLIHQSGAGIYSFLPLGLRVLTKLSSVVDRELAAAQCQKLDMPSILPADLWKKSGRWNSAGPELFRLQNRNGVSMCLLPTHEEVITSLVAHYPISQKQLPLRLYQIGRKFRDEIRPRFGLMRAVEFIMKVANQWCSSSIHVSSFAELSLMR